MDSLRDQTWTSRLHRRLTYFAKVPLWHLSRVSHPLRRPIWIASTRRSGSTLLAELLYTQPHTDLIDQPLSFSHPRRLRGTLPRHPSGRYISLNPKLETELRLFLTHLLSGSLRFRNQWNALDPSFSWQVNRLIIKELDSKAILEIIDRWFTLDVIYLIRHPIPTAASAAALGWKETTGSFLSCAAFKSHYLSQAQYTLAASISRKGQRLSKFVLEWCLDNLPTLRSSRRDAWLTLSFEELVTRPEQILPLLANRLSLPNAERMIEHVAKPSKTTRKQSADAIRSSGPLYIGIRMAEHYSALPEARD